MEPKIVQQPALLLAGFGFFGDPFKISAGWTEENEIGRLWSRFMAYLAQHQADLKHLSGEEVAYEVHLPHEETPQTGEFEVFVGLEVTEVTELPPVLSIKLLPAGAYAVFTLHGPQITTDWPRRIDQWLAESPYQNRPDFSFQRYDERFKGVDRIAESTIDVYVPLT